MEAKAIAKWVRHSPRKLRRYADLVRGRSIGDARAILTVMPSPAAKTLRKAIDSAVANAENNHEMDADGLWLSGVRVDQGFTYKHRWRARARGRADRLRRHTSHLTVVVSDEEREV